MSDRGGKAGRGLGGSLLVSWPVAVILPVATLLLGGITPNTTLIIGLLVFGLAIGSCWSCKRLPVISGVCLLLAVLTLLQLVPLPLGLLRLVAPESARVWTETGTLLAQPPSAAPLTIEPQATRLDAVRIGIYAAYAVLCQHLVTRGGARALSAIVTSTACLLAVVTLAHQAISADRVFGLYQPSHSSFVAPLMNTNNLAGLINLGFFCAAGLALDRRVERERRRVFLIAAVLLSGSAVWIGSRAGVVLLISGLLVLSVVIAWRSRRRGSSLRDVSALLIAAALGACLAALSVARLGRELFDDSFAKLDVIQPAFSALEDCWLTGAGRGAFGVAIAPYVDADSHFTSYEHAEIFPLQWSIDWGVLVGGALALGLVYSLRPSRATFNLPAARLGAYLGLVALVLHNLADFSLEVPGVALCALTVAFAWKPEQSAVFDFVSTRVRSQTVALLKPLQRHGLIVAIGVFGGVQLLCLALLPVELGRAERERVARSIERGTFEVQALDRILLAHPADPYLLRLGASRALAMKSPNVFRWLGWALERGPNSGRTMLLLADALAERGATHQTLPVLRRAIATDPGLAAAAAQRVLRWAPQQAANVVPQGRGEVAAWEALAQRAPHPKDRLTFQHRAATHANSPPESRLSLLLTALHASDEDCLSVLGESCSSYVQAHRGELDDNAPGLVEVDATLLSRGGDLAGAYELLFQQCPRSTKGIRCLNEMLRLATSLALPRHLQAIDVLLAASCHDDLSCARAEENVARSLRHRSQPELALPHLKRAATLDPSDRLWMAVALLADDVSDPLTLRIALEHLELLGVPLPSDLAAAKQRMQELNDTRQDGSPVFRSQ